VIWTSGASAAAPGHVLAFDEEAGSIAYVDRNGVPGRIDLRSGTVGVASRAKLTSLSSSDGYAIYGIAANGTVSRLTPAGDWSYTPPKRARLVLPQDDGTLLDLIDDGASHGVIPARARSPPGVKQNVGLRVTGARRAGYGQSPRHAGNHQSVAEPAAKQRLPSSASTFHHVRHRGSKAAIEKGRLGRLRDDRVLGLRRRQGCRARRHGGG
jgi:hypothetical protein